MSGRRRQGTPVAEGFFFLEGPRWREGRLYVSDFYDRRVLAFTPDGRSETVCEVPNQPSGLGFDPDGRLLVVSMLDRRLLRLEGTALVEVAQLEGLTHGPANDMVVDAEGGAYIGNFGLPGFPGDSRFVPTNLVRVDPDGTVSIAAKDVVFPNGTVVTPDGKGLFLAETFAGRISAFDRAGDGSLSNRRTWAAFGEPVYEDIGEATAGLPVLPDGMALDAEECLWIGDAKGDGALRVAEGGEIVDRVDTGELSVFAVALGGADRKTLFMCAGPPLGTADPAEARRGALLSCPVDVAGVGLP